MADVSWRPMRTPGHFISRVHRAMTRIGDARLKALGFATAQLPVLGALHSGEKRSQTDLARMAKVEQSSMAQLLARMQRDGLITREPDPEDRRSSLISLSTEARERLPAGREVLLQGARDMTRGLSDAEVETLVNLLERVLANIENLDA
jgi:MarR family transcriptional regulator for hemolysin